MLSNVEITIQYSYRLYDELTVKVTPVIAAAACAGDEHTMRRILAQHGLTFSSDDELQIDEADVTE